MKTPLGDKTGKRNYLALAIGLVFAGFAAVAVDNRQDFIASSATTQGKVSRLNYGEHHPEITFVTQAGERISFPGSFVTAEVGDIVPVRYDPAMPLASAEIDTFANIWGLPIFLSVMATGFIFGGWTGQEFRGRYG